MRQSTKNHSAILLLYLMFPMNMVAQSSKWDTEDSERVIVMDNLPISIPPQENIVLEPEAINSTNFGKNVINADEFKSFKESQYVKLGKDWYLLRADFNYLENSKSLQRELASFLFNVDESSLEAAFRKHIMDYQETRNPKHFSDNEDFYINYKIVCQSYMAGKYANFLATYTKHWIEKKFEKTRRLGKDLIFDIEQDRFLTIEDVFVPQKVEKINKILGDSLTYGLTTNEQQLYLFYLKKSKNGIPLQKPWKAETLYFSKNANLFSEYFRNLVGIDASLAEASLSTDNGESDDVQTKHYKPSLVKGFIKNFRLLEKYDERTGDALAHLMSENRGIKIKKWPEYPGGLNKFVQDFYDKFKYPWKETEGRVYGTTHVTFWVEQHGTISRVQITESIHPSIDEAIEQTMNQLSVWNPGIAEGVECLLKYSFDFEIIRTGETYEYTEITPSSSRYNNLNEKLNATSINSFMKKAKKSEEKKSSTGNSLIGKKMDKVLKK